MNRAATAILVVSSFLGGGSTVYSAFQIQLPSRTSLKVTPDAANVWSWHKEITFSGGTIRESVLVDFDGNGHMDTEDPDLRVTVTDMQVVLPPGFSQGLQGSLSIWLADSQNRRWALFQTDAAVSGVVPRTVTQTSLATPIILRPGSNLFIVIEGFLNPTPITVSLIGREIIL